MTVLRMTTAVLAVTLLTAAAALADWDPGDPYKMHYPQLPDLTPTGLDVLAGVSPIATPSQEPVEKMLADDWLCTQSGAVTDIHIWGSFNEDRWLDPLASQFSLAIYSNVPAGVDRPYSHPGELLWDAYVRPTVARPYATAQEGFFDPNLDEIIGFDTQVWQFNFLFDEANAFVQNRGEIYWLAVHYSFDVNGDGIVDAADVLDQFLIYPGAFGWKTSLEHFEDDAVWLDVETFLTPGHVVPPVGAMWQELRYPIGHPFGGQSIDLAFVITPEPATLAVLAVGVCLIRRGRSA